MPSRKSSVVKSATKRGRGAGSNPRNRFEELAYAPDPETEQESAPATTFYRDHSKSLITYNESPDLGFNASINPYRGCEHGCSYCYARPYHEYLGFSAGLDFETKILVKENAASLLRKELNAKKWQPQVLAMSGVTDCYQPAERHFEITRACLAVLAEFRNPVVIITKNRLVTRDLKILQELAQHQAVMVYLSITTLDSQLARVMEPRTSMPLDRILTLEELSAAGIPTGVLVAPVIPALNDAEVPAILHAAARAGARQAAYVVLRLSHGLKELFADWLEQHFPERKTKILHRLQEMRGGKLNDNRFGKRQQGEGVFAEQLAQLFAISCRRSKLNQNPVVLSTEHFRKQNEQFELFR